MVATNKGTKNKQSNDPHKVQNAYITDLCTEKQKAAVYLNSGLKLSGLFFEFDTYTVKLKTKKGKMALVFKHHIEAIIPLDEIE